MTVHGTWYSGVVYTKNLLLNPNDTNAERNIREGVLVSIRRV